MTDDMPELSRDDILAANDRELRKVDVPEWGGVVYVRTMSADERDQWELDTAADRDAQLALWKLQNPGANPDEAPDSFTMRHVRARYLAGCVCAKNGDLLFSAADVEALGQKAMAPMDRLFTVAKELNALSDEDVAELAGNSNDAQG